MKTVCSLLCLLAAAGGPGEKKHLPDTLDAGSLPAYLKVSDELAVGGQPDEATLARLGEMGFRTVVTLRPEAEGPAGEQAAVEKQGLAFLRVPVTPETLSLADAEKVAAILEDPDKAPVLLHCASSNRVGAVWALIEARRGKPVDEAIAAGKRLGLAKPETAEVVRKLLAAAEPASKPPAAK